MTTTEIAPAAALEPKTKLSGKIIKTTLAGALVDIGGSLPGVIHISQLQNKPVNKVEDVVKEGQVVDVWVRRTRKDRIELTMIKPLKFEWKEIQPDIVVKGRVVRIESYGAFVDFGAERPGLVHVSELGRGFVKTAGEVVKEGDEVEAKVLDVNRRKRQIRLSMKAVQAEIAVAEQARHSERPAHFDRPKRADRKGRDNGKRKGKNRKREANYEMDNEGPTEQQLTAMQIAWQEALERSKREKIERTRASKAVSVEQEEILSRTLEK